MRYVIGVDQGGSGTRAVICDLQGHLLGTGVGPGACHAFTGMEYAMYATQIAVRKALDHAGIEGGRRGETLSVEEFAALTDSVVLAGLHA